MPVAVWDVPAVGTMAHCRLRETRNADVLKVSALFPQSRSREEIAMRPSPRLPKYRRRGITLVEMIVVVGLLVLVMAILVAIFQSATGAISVSRTYAALDQDIRRVDTLLREDLQGATAHFTPPLNPSQGLGYFTYSESALADRQGEDTDDIIAFTAKAPQGRPFTGFVVEPRALGTNPGVDGRSVAGLYNRVAITSDFAEVIYFLRAGNLYRRVFLIQPERQLSSHTGTDTTGAMLAGGGFLTPNVNPNGGYYGLPTSWLGLNDVSARPSPFGGSYAPIMNTLSDLTNRENRAFCPRFADDYNGGASMTMPNPDGIADDFNGDGIRDFYPTLYPGVFSAPNPTPGYAAFGLTNLFGTVQSSGATLDQLPFPFAFPNAYSMGDPSTNTAASPAGAIHSLDATVDTRLGSFQNPPFNHAPVDQGDNLPIPTTGAQAQTWWGLPTKKETLSPRWTDPVKRINDPQTAAYYTATGFDTAFGQQSAGLSSITTFLLPPMTARWRYSPQSYNDAAGSVTFGTPTSTVTTPAPPWLALAEEDLILTNVRSFDVKAYDQVAGDYYDLGYMSGPTSYVTMPAVTGAGQPPVPNPAMYNQTPPFCWSPLGSVVSTLSTFGHEGRMPPMVADNRTDSQFPAFLIGDNGTNGVPVHRIRRVFDTWSTEYSQVPSQTVLNPVTGSTPQNGMPYSGGPPPMPSYPAPYPAPLRGIQIQLRVVDPSNQHIKSLTIRQDFVDKL